MKRLVIPLAAIFLCPLASHAGGVFKCITENSVIWQDVACTVNGDDLQTPPARNVIVMRREEGEAGDAARRSGANDVSQDKLQVGISDLLVLNNRRWGKPQRITRSREARTWHEYWNYATGVNGGKQLHFVNGRLASVADIEPPAPAVSTTTVELLDDH